MKKFVRIALLLAAWAAVTWLYRDKLLPLPRTDKGPVPHFRTGTAAVAESEPVAGRPTPHQDTSPDPSEPGVEPAPPGGDDLTEILGIGPVYRSRLADAGIATFADLAAADPADVAAAIEVADTMVEGWIAQAQEMRH